jgi:hypothetical protein
MVEQVGDNRLATAINAGGESTVSVFHQGNFMQHDKRGVQKANNLDAIDQMELPASWARFDQASVRSRSVVFSPVDNPSTEIGFLERHRPVDDKSSAAFENIVGSILPTPRVLYADTFGANPQNEQLFKTLASALGSTLVGDNQLTCPQTGPTCRKPAFHLENARVETINGKNVIAVDGWFSQMDDKAQIKMDADGPAKRYYSGIFFAAGADASKVDEMYLTADDKASYLSNKAVYRSATQSIKWR